MLSAIKNDYKTVFNKIYNKPWYELLDIDQNFFDDVFGKIKNTSSNEQLQNIYEFAITLNKSFVLLLEKEEIDVLQKINNILDIDSVQ